MENSNENTRSDQMMIVSGLGDVKKGSQFLFVLFSILSAFLIIIELLTLIDPYSLGSFMMIFASQGVVYTLCLAIIGVVLAGLIFSLNGLNAINNGSTSGFVKGSIGPSKLILLITIVSFSIISAFAIFAMMGIFSFRLMGLLAVPALTFVVSFYLFMPMMTFVAGGISETIKNEELLIKSKTFRNHVLIMVSLMMLQYIIVTFLGRDGTEIGLIVGIGTQAFGIYVYYSYFKLWGFASDNYSEKPQVIGSSESF